MLMLICYLISDSVTRIRGSELESETNDKWQACVSTVTSSNSSRDPKMHNMSRTYVGEASANP